ncbi:MAG: hypothetical protein H7X74_01355 [Methyloceanibacter sp.]|nr:hypothetical protein [Methyloceanibacter sp.]
MEGPVSITYPTSLAARLDALAVEDAFPAFEVLMSGAPRRDQALLAQANASLGEASPEGWAEGDDDGLGEAGELTVGAPLDPETRVLPQAHVQTVLREFRRRQHHASLLVAGSIATAVLLTVGGLVLVASLAAPLPADGDNRPLQRSTSVAWQRPANSNADAGLRLAVVSANRAAKGEPLLVPALGGAKPPLSGEAPSAPQTILAASGRQIAFAPLLPPSHAGYLLIRGLPPEAALSAGRQSESEAWLVKGEHVHDLTLSIGEAAEGDYPIEVYVLQSGDGPQARRHLVLRIEAPARTYPVAGPDMGWASALFDVVTSAHVAEEPAVPAEAAVLRERAMRLLDEGDIAAARLLLLHLAERGEGEAAYDLARTFDREMLAALGAIGMDGDPTRARGWYERASQDGNVKAAERLKILASLSGTGPSD